MGLSIATLLSQHHQVTAVDIVPGKVELINNRKSPIQDDYIEKYLAEKELNLTATLDAKAAYSDADFVVIAAPTNYDSHTQHFDTSAVEAQPQQRRSVWVQSGRGDTGQRRSCEQRRQRNICGKWFWHIKKCVLKPIPACHSLMKYEKAEAANTQKSSGSTGERTAKVWRGARCCWRWAM